jgi:hypothetical protein
MNKVLLTALAAALLAPAAHAGPRRVSVAHVNPPAHAGSSGSSGAPASSPVFYGTPPAAAGPASAAQPAASRPVWGSPVSGARGFSGGGQHRDINAGSFWGRRIDAPEPPTGGSGNGIPAVLMPGQLIRTAGLGALTSQPDVTPAMHTVEAGNRIAYEDSKGYAITTHQGVFTGPKDTPPPANPLFGGSSGAGGSGITENVNVNTTNNSHSNNGNGNGNGGGNGGDGGSSGH